MRIIVLLLISAASAACGSQIQSASEYATLSVGRNIDEYRAGEERPGSYVNRTGWKETKYDLPNGNWVYIKPLGKDCLIHWEVDRAGEILKYKLEGAGCD